MSFNQFVIYWKYVNVNTSVRRSPFEGNLRTVAQRDIRGRLWADRRQESGVWPQTVKSERAVGTVTQQDFRGRLWADRRQESEVWPRTGRSERAVGTAGFPGRFWTNAPEESQMSGRGEERSAGTCGQVERGTCRAGRERNLSGRSREVSTAFTSNTSR